MTPTSYASVDKRLNLHSENLGGLLVDALHSLLDTRRSQNARIPGVRHTAVQREHQVFGPCTLR